MQSLSPSLCWVVGHFQPISWLLPYWMKELCVQKGLNSDCTEFFLPASPQLVFHSKTISHVYFYWLRQFYLGKTWTMTMKDQFHSIILMTWKALIWETCSLSIQCHCSAACQFKLFHRSTNSSDYNSNCAVYSPSVITEWPAISRPSTNIAPPTRRALFHETSTVTMS